MTSLWTTIIKTIITIFKQELFNRMAQKKMDEEGRKAGGIHNVANKTEHDHDEDETVEIWSADWQCYICGLAQKRGRDDDPGEERKKQRTDDDLEDDQQESKGSKGSKGGKVSKGGKGGKGLTAGGGRAGVAAVRTFKESAPKVKGEGARGSLLVRRGKAGGQVGSQAHPHSNGENGSPTRKRKEKGETEVRVRRGKVRGREAPWESWGGASSGDHNNGDHPLANSKTQE